MPARWDTESGEAPEISGASSHEQGEPPLARLVLWPHRSLSPRGFAIFIAATAIMFLFPLMAVLGTPVLWGLLPFLLGAMVLIWVFLRRSYRDGEIVEELTFWSDHVRLAHKKKQNAPLLWDANVHWVSIHMHKKGGPVPAYITLRGNGREVELGSFLSQEEREALHPTLAYVLSRAAASPGPSA